VTRHKKVTFSLIRFRDPNLPLFVYANMLTWDILNVMQEKFSEELPLSGSVCIERLRFVDAYRVLFTTCNVLPEVAVINY
jgi:hypothetical protein